MTNSKFTTKWYLVVWHCPNDTKEAQKLRKKFNRIAGESGYPVYPLSPSVCARLVIGKAKIDALVQQLPPDSEFRVLEITDKQYERMEIHRGKLRAAK